MKHITKVMVYKCQRKRSYKMSKHKEATTTDIGHFDIGRYYLYLYRRAVYQEYVAPAKGAVYNRHINNLLNKSEKGR